MTAPVALFVYNRLDTLQETLKSLQADPLASSSDLHVFSDGPKSQEDAAKVEAVRAFLKTVSGFRSVAVHEKPANAGLAGSIIAGVSEMTDKFGRVIVLEDDLVCSPHLLKFMNDALDLYESTPEVISVCAYTHPLGVELPETFLLPGADCWGWATWKDRWTLFNPDGAELLRLLKSRRLLKTFNYNSSPIISNTSALKAQIAGRNNSWAIRWHASAVLNERLSLFPGRSLVVNIGCGSGTNCKLKHDCFTGELSKTPVVPKLLPLAYDRRILKTVSRFHLKANLKMAFSLAFDKLTKMLRPGNA